MALFDPLAVHRRARAADRNGISSACGRTLLALCALGPLNNTRLAEETGFARPTVATAVRRLQASRLVDEDRRVTVEGRIDLFRRLAGMKAEWNSTPL